MTIQETATAAQPRRRQSAAPADDGDCRTSWLVSRAHTHLCAIPLEHVIEIMRPLPMQAVAGAPGYVRGLCIIRGSAVPVVDTGLLVGDHASEAGRLVSVRAGGRTIALATEAVLGIHTIDAETFKELPPLLQEAAGETVAAMGILDAELLFLLRTTRIVPADLLDRLAGDGASS